MRRRLPDRNREARAFAPVSGGSGLGDELVRGAGAWPRNILVRAPNWLGDLVMSTPGLRSLRAGFPRAQITLWARPALLPLMRGSPFVDRLLPLNSHRSGLFSMALEARGVRHFDRFDLGVCIPESFSSALLMRLSGVRMSFGYGRIGRRIVLQRVLHPPAEWGRRRMVARERFVLGLMTELGCPDLGTRLELHTDRDEEAAARAVLASLGLDKTGAPLVALAPGASYGPSKLWPARRYAVVGDALARSGAQVLLIGSADERSLTHAVASAMQRPAVDLVGALDLGGLKALVRRLSLLLCNDAGARHLAAAFGVPSIVFMGPTALAKTNLNLENVTVLQTDAECRPCYHRRCPTDHHCLLDIDTRSVVDLALAKLAERPDPSTGIGRGAA